MDTSGLKGVIDTLFKRERERERERREGFSMVHR